MYIRLNFEKVLQKTMKLGNLQCDSNERFKFIKKTFLDFKRTSTDLVNMLKYVKSFQMFIKSINLTMLSVFNTRIILPVYFNVILIKFHILNFSLL